MSVYINRALSVSISIVRLCASETLSRCTKWGAFGTQRSELASHYVFFFSRPNHTCKRECVDGCKRCPL